RSPELNEHYAQLGGFESAVRRMWDVYDRVPTDAQRSLLLEYCSVLTYPDEAGRVSVRDPIQLVIDSGTRLCREGESAVAELEAELDVRRQQEVGLVDSLQGEMTSGLPQQGVLWLVEAVD